MRNKLRPYGLAIVLILKLFSYYDIPTTVCGASDASNNNNKIIIEVDSASSSSSYQDGIKNEPNHDEAVKVTATTTTITKNRFLTNNNNNDKDEEEEEEAAVHTNGTITFPFPSFINYNEDGSITTTMNTTEMTIGACRKINIALSYVTSLDFDDTFLNPSISKKEQSAEFVDIYLLQIIVTPISFAMLFFGSQLLIPMCIITSSTLAVFLVFHFSKKDVVSAFAGGDILCQSKLLVSFVCAMIAGFAASSFLKFGLFCIGTLAAGSLSYLLFDAFPILDYGMSMYMHNSTNFAAEVAAGAADFVPTESDLSTIGWVVTIFIGTCGGILSRMYEQSTLEILTSVIGGIGCSYSLHTTVIMNDGQLDRSLVFMITAIISIFGWRFQRKRRFSRVPSYYHNNDRSDNVSTHHHKRNDDDERHNNNNNNNMKRRNHNNNNNGMMVLPPGYQQHHQVQPMSMFVSPPLPYHQQYQGFPSPQQHYQGIQQSQQGWLPSWMNRNNNHSVNGGLPASSVELTTSLNTLAERIENYQK